MFFLSKKLLLLLFMLTLLISDKVSMFKVDGMMCLSGCVVKVNSIANSIDGVKRASVNFKKGILTVKYDSLMVSEDFIMNELSQKTTYVVKIAEKDFGKKMFDWLKIF
mgnify:FL=1